MRMGREVVPFWGRIKKYAIVRYAAFEITIFVGYCEWISMGFPSILYITKEKEEPTWQR